MTENVWSTVANLIYEGVGKAAQTAVAVSESVDKFAGTVQNTIERIEVDYPEWFGFYEEEDEADLTDETVDESKATAPVEHDFTRAQKIKIIQTHMSSKGMNDNVWFTNPEAISDVVVDAVFDVISKRLKENDEAAAKSPNGWVTGYDGVKRWIHQTGR